MAFEGLHRAACHPLAAPPLARVQGNFHMASGVPIKALPAGAWLHHAKGTKAKEGTP